jgi:NTP pyrophosphatase (non-canonical NTP hydrolase)
MDLDEYQRAAEATDVRPDPSDPALPLLGLAGEVGSLVTEYKARLRDGDLYTRFDVEVREDLGDLLWYAATVARTLGLSSMRQSHNRTVALWRRGSDGIPRGCWSRRLGKPRRARGRPRSSEALTRSSGFSNLRTAEMTGLKPSD